MFRPLRIRLTLLYVSAGFALTLLMGGGSYLLVRYYFQVTTDLALQRKVTLQLQQDQLTVAPAARIETAVTPTLLASVTAPGGQATSPEGEEEGSSEDQGKAGAAPSSSPPGPTASSPEHPDELYDSELAAIFVMPLDEGGEPLGSSTSASPISPDHEAAAAASAHGKDVRTLALPQGMRVRLLTVAATRGDQRVILQAGRLLTDQDRILREMLLGLLVLGAVSLSLLGAASWGLAGRSLEPAERAWERQQTFVANASHELRAPLTLMRASAEVAQRGRAGGAASQEMLADILAEIDHMSRLVEDLLLLSRLDSGRVTLDLKPIAAADLLAEVQRQVGRLAEESRVEVSLGPVAGVLWADPMRVRQVLLALLDNALRHTPRGGRITLEARPQGRHVVLIVADTGTGIPSQHLPHVLERFYRAPDTRSPGSGLGLSIAKGLVEAMGGQMRLESEVGQGTRALLTLPSAA